ncbi:MAG: HAD family hydrolase [Candidatus Neomarinimicrobiota bacterium]|jgi:phosphoglycolate phosphatase-like HAD superfamily hydrolase
MSRISQANPLFNPATDILALDFDGVVVDSIAECLIVGYNAYQNAIGRVKRITGLDQMSISIQKESRRLRNFIRHGEDYVYIFQIITEKYLTRDQTDFDRFVDKNIQNKEEFRMQFYRERSRFLQEEPALWLSLNSFYKGMSDFLKNYKLADRLYIITTKKLEYVKAILAHAGIILPEENLFAADSSRGKPEIIADLLEKTKLRPNNFFFIDDQVDTLLKLQTLNVRLFLASWGYTNKQQIRQAKASGIQPLTLSEFFQIFNH